MTTPRSTKPADPLALLRTRRYMALLVLAAILGVPIAALAYFFLKLVDVLQKAVFTNLPSGLGFHGEPLWWPLLPLAVAGVLVGLTIRYLPGKGGHSPADGFHAGGTISSDQIPGVFLAALATLSLGAVLGPEAPLIALGGGLAVLAVHFRQRDMPAQTLAVVGAAGSFAAIATLFGSPLPAAFLLMEVAGLGGAMLDIALLPGLLAAGIGALIFVGLDAWTGFGTFSLAIPNLPPYSHSRSGPVRLGPGDRARSRPGRHRHPPACPGDAGRRSNGAWWRSPRWRGWRSPGWRSRSRPAPGRAPRRCCSPGSPRSARSSARPPATRSGRCCCWWRARGWPTACR